MEAARLIAMANQIGQFFRAQGNAAAVEGIEDHLRKYWEPRMRREIIAVLETGGAGLDPNVREAVARLKNVPNRA
jgi:formate dehydrogenase subunit delta